MTKKQMIEIDGIECPDGWRFSHVGAIVGIDWGGHVIGPNKTVRPASDFADKHGQPFVFVKKIKPKRIVFEEVLPRPDMLQPDDIIFDLTGEMLLTEGGGNSEKLAVYRRVQVEDEE